MYNDPLDNQIQTADRRLVQWIIEFIRKFAAEPQTYQRISDEIATKYRYDNTMKLGIRIGRLRLNDIKNYAQSEILKETSMSIPLYFTEALLSRLRTSGIGVDLSAFVRLGPHDPNVMLNPDAITSLVSSDCLDNAIMGIPYILEKYASSVCHIAVRNKRDGQEHGGTGFVIAAGSQEFIITNKHIVDPTEREILRILVQRRPIEFSGILVATSHDIAAVQVASRMDVPTFRLQLTFRILQNIVTMGYPFVARLSEPVLMVHGGQINGVSDTTAGERLMFISADVSPGSSGGPVLNEMGQVVGVTTQLQEADYGDHGRSIHRAAVPSSCVFAVFVEGGDGR